MKRPVRGLTSPFLILLFGFALAVPLPLVVGTWFCNEFLPFLPAGALGSGRIVEKHRVPISTRNSTAIVPIVQIDFHGHIAFKKVSDESYAAWDAGMMVPVAYVRSHPEWFQPVVNAPDVSQWVGLIAATVFSLAMILIGGFCLREALTR